MAKQHCLSSVFCVPQTCLPINPLTSFLKPRRKCHTPVSKNIPTYLFGFFFFNFFSQQTYSSSNCNKQHTTNSKTGEKTLTVNKMRWRPQYTQTLCMLKHKLRKCTHPLVSVSIAIIQKTKDYPKHFSINISHPLYLSSSFSL